MNEPLPIGDFITCEVCGLVKPDNSLVWKLAGELQNDFPVCPTCVILAEETVVQHGGKPEDHAAICEQLETWSQDKSQMRG